MCKSVYVLYYYSDIATWFIIVGSLYGPDVQWLTTSVLDLSHARISKTEQDRPIVTTVHQLEVGTATAGSATVFSPPQTPSGEILRYQICANINTASCGLAPKSTWRQTTVVVNHRLTTGVLNCCKQSVMVRTRCSLSSSTPVQFCADIVYMTIFKNKNNIVTVEHCLISLAEFLVTFAWQ